MTSKTKNQKFSIFGITALAAVLSVAMITMSFSGIQAQAEPANKVSWMNDDVAFALGWQDGQDPAVNEVILQEFSLKTSDKGDWLFDMAAECSTFTTIEAKGKNNDQFSGSTAGAVVTLYVDGEANKSWNLCQQDFQTKAYLNDVIVEDEEGNLKFNCSETGTIDPDTPCEQFVQLYLLNAGSYNAKWVAANLSAGVDHLIQIKATLNAGPSQLTEDAPTDTSGIDAGVIIGRNVVIAEPIHVAVGDL